MGPLALYMYSEVQCTTFSFLHSGYMCMVLLGLIILGTSTSMYGLSDSPIRTVTSSEPCIYFYVFSGTLAVQIRTTLGIMCTLA